MSDESLLSYLDAAHNLARWLMGNPSDAEDVVQEAYLRALAGAERRRGGDERAWLLSIVHHRAIDAVRRRRATVDLPERDDAPPPAMRLPDVWGEVSSNLDADEVRAALASLSDVQREALELAYFGGLTQTEIAERTGTPLGTVKSRMRLGLLAMREMLSP